MSFTVLQIYGIILLALDYPKNTNKTNNNKNPKTPKQQQKNQQKPKLCWSNSIHKLLSTAEDTAIEHKKCKVTVFRGTEESKSPYICAIEGRKFVFHWKFRLFHGITHVNHQPDQCWYRLNPSLAGGSKKVNFSQECIQAGLYADKKQATGLHHSLCAVIPQKSHHDPPMKSSTKSSRGRTAHRVEEPSSARSWRGT